MGIADSCGVILRREGLDCSALNWRNMLVRLHYSRSCAHSYAREGTRVPRIEDSSATAPSIRMMRGVVPALIVDFRIARTEIENRALPRAIQHAV